MTDSIKLLVFNLIKQTIYKLKELIGFILFSNDINTYFLPIILRIIDIDQIKMKMMLLLFVQKASGDVVVVLTFNSFDESDFMFLRFNLELLHEICPLLHVFNNRF